MIDYLNPPPLILLAAVYTRINGVTRLQTIQTVKTAKEDAES